MLDASCMVFCQTTLLPASGKAVHVFTHALQPVLGFLGILMILLLFGIPLYGPGNVHPLKACSSPGLPMKPRSLAHDLAHGTPHSRVRAAHAAAAAAGGPCQDTYLPGILGRRSFRMATLRAM